MTKNRVIVPIVILLCFGLFGLAGTLVFSLYAGMTFKNISFADFNIAGFLFPMLIGMPISCLFILIAVVILAFTFGKDFYQRIIDTLKNKRGEGYEL